ncbi:MAG: hypothetical protein KBS95_04975 [Alistipes sp.]|nr:hypothetical protein [Candidatus Alistipes equi]
MKNHKYLIIVILVLFALCICHSIDTFAQDDYYVKKATEYTKEAEYYQTKAQGYYREAEYYLKKAESYEREAMYYTKKGDTYNANRNSMYARSARDKYLTQVGYAKTAEERAADYLRRAQNMLRR